MMKINEKEAKVGPFKKIGQGEANFCKWPLHCSNTKHRLLNSMTIYPFSKTHCLTLAEQKGYSTHS